MHLANHLSVSFLLTTIVENFYDSFDIEYLRFEMEYSYAVRPITGTCSLHHAA